jgi:hypothetical protein
VAVTCTVLLSNSLPKKLTFDHKNGALRSVFFALDTENDQYQAKHSIKSKNIVTIKNISDSLEFHFINMLG